MDPPARAAPSGNTGHPRSTTEQHAFIAQLLTFFIHTEDEDSIEAANEEVFARIDAHPELATETFADAVRQFGRAVDAQTGGAPPVFAWIAARLGVFARRQRDRKERRAKLASAFSLLGEALARYPGGTTRVAVREAAVAGCRVARELLVPDTPPWIRAETLSTLGSALLAREMGDREANVREAIEWFRAALHVLENEPELRVQWASVQSNLAFALLAIPSADQRTYQEEALAALRLALDVLDQPGVRDVFPGRLARVQMVLGHLLVERIAGDREKNAREALQVLLPATRTWLEQGRDVDLASTVTVAGNAFMALNDRDALDDAVKSFTLALQTLRRDTHPPEWATLQGNLGTAHLRLAGHVEGTERARELGLAITALTDAIEVLEECGLGYWTALCQLNLCSAYVALAGEEEEGGGDPAASVARAIEAGTRAGAVFTREAFPRRWAGVRQMLGTASLVSRSASPDDAARALATMAEALEVFTADAFPHDALSTGRVLGLMAFERGRWDLAVTGYLRGVEAAEQLRRQTTAEGRRDDILITSVDLFSGLVRSLLSAGRTAEALAAAERGKSRQLSELLAEQSLRPTADLPPMLLDELGRARGAELSAGRMLTAAVMRRETGAAGTAGDAGASPATPGDGDDAELAELVASLQAAREAVGRALAAIQAYDPAFALAQAESPPLTPAELHALLPDGRSALLSLYEANDLYAFVLTEAGVHAEVTSGEETAALQRAIATYRELCADAPDEAPGWTGDPLGDVLGALDVVSRAVATVPAHVDRLLLLSHQALHLVPLHALRVGDATLADRFPRGVVYAPSARLLELAQRRQRGAFDTLLAVQDPASSRPLPATELEVGMVARQFPRPACVLRGPEATRSAVLNAPELTAVNALHFACHGKFDPGSPLSSALLLAGDEPLTLAEVFALRLGACRLTVLSACETGQVAVGTTEEYVGLPAGFLYAGSAAVVSSLWAVEDISTALLAARMYERLRESGDPCAPYAVAEALSVAQRWLRDSTGGELDAWLDAHCTAGLERWRGSVRTSLATRLRGAAAEASGDEFGERPFADPYYWAPFIATGC